MTEQPGDDPAPVFSFLGSVATASRAAAVLDHAYQPAHPRDHSRGPRSFADVHRRDRRRSVRATARRSKTRSPASPTRMLAPDLPRARRADDARDLSERNLDQPALRRPGRISAFDQRPGERSTDASRLCDRVRLFRSRGLEVLARNQGHSGPVFRRPDQRHDRIRGSRCAGLAGGHQRGAAGQRRRSRGARAATRPISACSWTISSRAASPNRIACSPAAPSIASACGKTMLTCA